MGILLNKEMIWGLWTVVATGGEVEIDGTLSVRSFTNDRLNKSHWNGGEGSGGYEPNDRPDPDTRERPGPDARGERNDSPVHNDFMDALEPIAGPGANLATIPGGRIEVNRDEAKEWETFKFYKAPDGRVAIKSHVGYFSSRDGGITADAATVSESEMWRVLGNPDGTVTLSGSNGRRLIGGRVTWTLSVPLFPPVEFTFDETAFVLTPKREVGRNCFALMSNRRKFVSVQP